MSIAFVFPGQGSQVVGMGKDLFDETPIARRRFEEASDLLKRDISRLCFLGPEEELAQTHNTQPALFTVEAILIDILAEQNIQPAVALGHSLGEYSALYCAGVVSFAEGLKVVSQRGLLMSEAARVKPGAMAAIIGLEYSKIAETLKDVTSGIVVCANFNSPEQIVISGETAAVNEACTKLKSAGAKRTVLLPVSGAFHSPLMQPAASDFAKVIDPIEFRTPAFPIISNVTARPETHPATLKALLIEQLVSPVRWVDSVQYIVQNGVRCCLEVGPGVVLQGLCRKIAPTLQTRSCGKFKETISLTIF